MEGALTIIAPSLEEHDVNCIWDFVFIITSTLNNYTQMIATLFLVRIFYVIVIFWHFTTSTLKLGVQYMHYNTVVLLRSSCSCIFWKFARWFGCNIWHFASFLTYRPWWRWKALLCFFIGDIFWDMLMSMPFSRCFSIKSESKFFLPLLVKMASLRRLSGRATTFISGHSALTCVCLGFNNSSLCWWDVINIIISALRSISSFLSLWLLLFFVLLVSSSCKQFELWTVPYLWTSK